MEQELIKSNQFLAQQVWILGGTIIFLLSVLGFFARSAWLDMKQMLEDHEDRIRKVEDHKIEMQQVQMGHIQTTPEKK